MCLDSVLFLPDDRWVKLTGVQVDESKGDSDGKLPYHAESDRQYFNVLWEEGGLGVKM